MKALGLYLGMALCTVSCAVVVSFDSYSEERRLQTSPDAAHGMLYGVRGTVQGLEADQGAYVVLNDRSALTNVQNGTFSFPPSVADGEPWRLVASATEIQETGLAVRTECTVRPDGGVIASSDVTGVEVRCAPSDASLEDLAFHRSDTDGLRVGTLSPPFDPETVDYQVSVDTPFGFTCEQLGSATLYLHARNSRATVTVGDKPLAAPGRSAAILIFRSESTRIEVNVTAGDMTHSRRYVLTAEPSGCR